MALIFRKNPVERGIASRKAQTSDRGWAAMTPENRKDRGRIKMRGTKNNPWRAMARIEARIFSPTVWSIMLLRIT